MKKLYNIVTNYQIIQFFKKSKYFRTNLGMSITMEKNHERILSDKDPFAASYNYQYHTSIYGQGQIGNIRFYVDHYIKESKIAAYLDLEEFIFDFDEEFIKTKGIDAYVGNILMRVDSAYKEKMESKKALEENKTQKIGNPNNLIKNPGAVTYEDIKEYLKNKKI